jgi:hypothetical protein
VTSGASGTFTKEATAATIAAMAKKPKLESVYCFDGRAARELIKRIDDYRFSRRMPSRAAAIRTLIEIALNHDEEGVKDGSKKS